VMFAQARLEAEEHGTVSYWFCAHVSHGAHDRSAVAPQGMEMNCWEGHTGVHATQTGVDAVVHTPERYWRGAHEDVHGLHTASALGWQAAVR
jgi:hypothetical protein